MKTIRLILLTITAALVTQAHAQFSFTTNNGAITITGYTGPGGDVTVPDTTNGFPVTSIGVSAFASCTSLATITIPDSVTDIGRYSFSLCTNLVSATIGNSVTSIGMYAFSRCYSLTSITIPQSVRFIDWYAFRYCTSLTNVAICGGLGSLPYMGFYYCTSLTSITIPRSVSFLDWYAFQDCTNLATVCFQGDAPTLGSDVFLGDNKLTVYYLPGTSGWGSTFGGRPTAFWFLPSPKILTGPSFGVQTNGFGFVVSWATNLSVVVEGCSDLRGPNWSPLGTNALTNGWFNFNDPDWTKYPSRLYRIRLCLPRGDHRRPSARLSPLLTEEGGVHDGISSGAGRGVPHLEMSLEP
jgi:hypothetical protein